MATLIREICLDERDRPNENAARVQAALNRKGCLFPTRSGGCCGAKVVFCPLAGTVSCTANRKHECEAYSEPVADIVFEVIDQINKEEAARPPPTEEEVKRLAAERAREYAERKAKEEAKTLGLADFTAHVRPDGAAPGGKTWSFTRGEWVREDFLRHQQQMVDKSEYVEVD